MVCSHLLPNSILCILTCPEEYPASPIRPAPLRITKGTPRHEKTVTHILDDSPTEPALDLRPETSRQNLYIQQESAAVEVPAADHTPVSPLTPGHAHVEYGDNAPILSSIEEEDEAPSLDDFPAPPVSPPQVDGSQLAIATYYDTHMSGKLPSPTPLSPSQHKFSFDLISLDEARQLSASRGAASPVSRRAGPSVGVSQPVNIDYDTPRPDSPPVPLSSPQPRTKHPSAMMPREHTVRSRIMNFEGLSKSGIPSPAPVQPGPSDVAAVHPHPLQSAPVESQSPVTPSSSARGASDERSRLTIWPRDVSSPLARSPYDVYGNRRQTSVRQPARRQGMDMQRDPAQIHPAFRNAEMNRPWPARLQLPRTQAQVDADRAAAGSPEPKDDLPQTPMTNAKASLRSRMKKKVSMLFVKAKPERTRSGLDSVIELEERPTPAGAPMSLEEALHMHPGLPTEGDDVEVSSAPIVPGQNQGHYEPGPGGRSTFVQAFDEPPEDYVNRGAFDQQVAKAPPKARKVLGLPPVIAPETTALARMPTLRLIASLSPVTAVDSTQFLPVCPIEEYGEESVADPSAPALLPTVDTVPFGSMFDLSEFGSQESAE